MSAASRAALSVNFAERTMLVKEIWRYPVKDQLTSAEEQLQFVTFEESFIRLHESISMKRCNAFYAARLADRFDSQSPAQKQ